MTLQNGRKHHSQWRSKSVFDEKIIALLLAPDSWPETREKRSGIVS